MDISGTADLAWILAQEYGLELAESPVLLAEGGGVQVWQVTAAEGQWVARLYAPAAFPPARVRADVALYTGLRCLGRAAPEVLPGPDGNGVRGAGAGLALVVTRAERLRPLAPSRASVGELAALGAEVARLHVASRSMALAALFPKGEREARDEDLWPGLAQVGLHGGLAGGQRRLLPDGRLYLYDLAQRRWGPAVYDLADLALWCAGGPGEPAARWLAWRGRAAAILAGYVAERPLSPADERAFWPLVARRAEETQRRGLAALMCLRGGVPCPG
jgi:Ser/Thr protein kinase RdoA (MazF antagonist)